MDLKREQTPGINNNKNNNYGYRHYQVIYLVTHSVQFILKNTSLGDIFANNTSNTTNNNTTGATWRQVLRIASKSPFWTIAILLRKLTVNKCHIVKCYNKYNHTTI